MAADKTAISIISEPVSSRDKVESLEQFKDITSGLIAGAIAKIIEYPFDTLKVLCQIEDTNIQNRSVWRNTKTLMNEGVHRIYRGLSAPLIGSCGENLIIFWFFGASERFLQKYATHGQEISLFQVGLCGCFAGFGNTFWITPIEFVKCQMQAPNTAIMYNNSTLNCFLYNIKTNPRLLFQGNALMGSGMREIPGSFIWFTGYNATKRVLINYFVDDGDKDNIPSWIFLCGGASAGLTYWSACYPFDLIKSIIQTQQVEMEGYTSQDTSKNNKTASFWKQFFQRYRDHGFRSLYNGFSATVPRAILSNACIFLCYEYCRTWMGKVM